MTSFNETTRKPVVIRRRQAQRGSALLVVLVFAAIIAIMLYRELPIAAFEAQRQKEDLLVSRGNEYKRGIKLFVRKVGRFPNSIAELESTNRMRFLRHKYTDPLTGKDDWRLVHAGPGGVIIDSKVKTKATGAQEANALGQGATFAGFNNTFTGDATATSEIDAPSAGMRQRSAATKNATGAANDPLALAAGGGDAVGTQPASVDAVTGQSNAQSNNGGIQLPNGLNNNGGNGNTTGIQPDATAGASGISTVAQQLSNTNPQAPEKAPGQPSSAFGNTSTFGNPATSNAGNGQIGAAGGIAGVASIAPGKSIKTVNDQTKYKLWEFYYDLRKEQNAAMPGALRNQQNQSAPGIQTGNTLGSNGNSGLGQTSPSNQSTFGFGGQAQPQATQTIQQPQQQ